MADEQTTLTVEQRAERELREKYNTAAREKLAKEGKALPDGSYPIGDKEDLTNAAILCASGHGDVAAAKALIRKRAKELGVDVESLPGFGKESKADDAQAEERDEPKPGMKVCPTCKGDGTIMGGNRECPDCEGSGEVSATQQNAAKPRRKERRRAVPLMPEVRFWQAEGLEVRSSKDTDEIIITGTPIVYNAPYTVTDMFGEFQERMLPGVASAVLERGADVRFLFNHDGLPLARTTSGTLELQDTPSALRMTARLDARQQLANDLAIATERGDVSQMSCGFIVARDEWDDAMENRDVEAFADLLDVSSVTYPASPTTATQVAQRMALMAPIESRARLRNFIVAERAGATLSGASKEKVVSAIEALHGLYEAGGGNVADLIPDDGDQLQTDGSDADTPEGQAFLDGTGERFGGVDPGEKIRTKTSRVLLMEIEKARKRPRIAA